MLPEAEPSPVTEVTGSFSPLREVWKPAAAQKVMKEAGSFLLPAPSFPVHSFCCSEVAAACPSLASLHSRKKKNGGGNKSTPAELDPL